MALWAVPSIRPETEAITVASWDTPSWADQSVANEDSVVHRHRIGEIDPADGGPSLRIEVVQRDELALVPESAAITRTEAQVSIMGELLTPQEARDLARLLGAAADILELDAASAALRLRRLLAAT